MAGRQFRPQLQVLENRENPSVSLMSGGALVVTGTDQADVIRVFNPVGETGKVTVDETTKGVTTAHTFDQADVKRLVIFGGKGDDVITNDTAIRAVIFGGAGNDVITGGSSADLIVGGPGNDVIRGGAGNDIIFGGPGNDAIYGGTGNNVIFGGKGHDAVFGATSHDVVHHHPSPTVESGHTFEHIDALIGRLENKVHHLAHPSA